jgi:hypothetical protein
VLVVIASALVGWAIATNIKQNTELRDNLNTIGILSNDVAGLRTQIYSLGQTPTAPPPEVRTEGNITTVVGPKGDKGETGSPGKDGKDGSTPTCYFFDSCIGPMGLTGPKGDNGTNGTNGIDGKNGTDGMDGATGPQGEQGISGSEGPQGVQGEQGPQGSEGPQGPQGIQGEQGFPGPLAPTYSVTNPDGTSMTCVLDAPAHYTCKLDLPPLPS